MKQDIEHLIHEVLHGHASAEDVQRLSAWITASKDNARAYYRVLSDERAIHRCLEQDAARAVSQLSDESGDSAAGYVLAELAEAEANAEATLVELVHIKDRRWIVGSLKKYAWAALIAFATLTAVIVTLLVGPNHGPTSSPVADGPRETVPTTPEIRQAVATLTATHNAQWSGGPASAGLRTGDTLHPGQRLTLTQGFAEITTNRGAVAILQAPCKIELTNSNNALHLHTGKLVGICETDSSKGFLVRTPHMDVTDLGTRFGVDASEDNATEVHVLEGEVRVARAGVEPVLLAVDQSAKASAGSSAITVIEFAPKRFTAALVESGLGNRFVALNTDSDGQQWLLALSDLSAQGNTRSANYEGNRVACTVDHNGFTRGIGNGNAYGFIQYRAFGAGDGKAATATGTWTFSNLPAGRYDVATAFEPKRDSASAVRYTVNGVEVLVDQLSVPTPDAGPTFETGLETYSYRTTEVLFTQIGSSVAVPEGGSITVTIDNANTPLKTAVAMDAVAITLVPEAGPN